MKVTKFILITLSILPVISNAATCAEQNPSGPANVISCAAKEAKSPSAEDFWNEKLFSTIALDGYCRKAMIESTVAQREIYKQTCNRESGSYFSYANFIAADEEIKLRTGSNYEFMRTGSYQLKLEELSNFLATAAQETTGNGVLPIKYQNDGLYFRYEAAFLQGDTCFIYPANPGWISGTPREKGTDCKNKTLSQYLTNYYPFSTYVVALNSTESTQLYTKFVMDNDAQYDLTQPNIAVTFFRGKPDLLPGGSYVAPTGTVWQYMNQTIPYGYWIGLGNLQLTGVSMTQFFGWYYQNIDITKPDYANFNTFIDNYLGNGKLAWEGGLWFWNFRINGYQQPTLHSILTGSKAACHDIAITTRLVNGGCNDYDQRVSYYTYFKSNVFKLPNQAVPYTYQGFSSNSMMCTSQLQAYCSSK